MPVRGMSSFMDASALGPGWYPLLQNVRTDKGTIRVRDGHAKLTSTAINSGTGTFGGAGIVNYQGFWSGNPLIAAGVEVSSATRVYGTNTGTSFAELTAGSGQYGNTRFGALSAGDGRIYVGSGYDRITNDSFGIFQNGTSDPRIYSITGLIASGHYAITPPQASSALRAKPTFPVFFTVKTSGTTTHTTPTGTSLAFADSGASATENSITLTATNPVNGDQAQAVFSAGISFANSRQIVFVANSNSTNFNLWNNIKIEVDNNTAGWLTVYDPTTAGNGAYGIANLTTNGENYALGFSLDQHTGSSVLATADRIRVTWVGGSLAATTLTVTIYAIAGSGLVPGNAVHAYTYANSTSKAESVPIYLLDTSSERIQNVGGSAALNLDIGNSSEIFYNYVITYLNTTAAEKNLGTDKLYLYRKDEDDTEYFYVKTVALAAWNSGAGTWDYSSGAAYGLLTTTDSTLAKNYLIKAPDPENIPIPIGTAMCFANGRLFVAKSSSGLANSIYISDHRYPSRFRSTPKLLDDGTIDVTSGTVYEFPGEIVKALVSSSVGYGGQSFVYIFTDLSVYMVGQNVHQIQRVSSYGTLSPASIAEHKGTIVFLSSDLMVNVIENGAVRDISDQLVEDILRAIPTSAATTSRLSKASGRVFNGRYYLGYSPSGATTNTRCLMYDFEEKKWYDDVSAAGTYEELLIWHQSGKPKMVFIGSNLHLYEAELSTQTTDDGTIPTIAIHTPEFKMEDWHKFSIGRVGVVCDDVSSGVIAVSRYYSPGTSTPSTSTISVDVTPDEAWKYDGAQTLNDANGYRGQLRLTSSTLIGGTHIREIVAEFHPRRRGAG